ncbi:MAG: hypothetical protein IJM47_02100 [Synergistaceae bacterium]|nr:hypothetical protein [Synergistaceae bacterium]MBQ9903559.1 hypothetical protein [Synergistaceae bacterium]
MNKDFIDDLSVLFAEETKLSDDYRQSKVKLFCLAMPYAKRIFRSGFQRV